MRGDLCPFDHGSDPVVVDDVNLSNVLQLNQGPSQSNLAISIAGQPPPPPPPPMHPMGPRAIVPGQRPPIIASHGPLRPQNITGPPPPPTGPPPRGTVVLKSMKFNETIFLKPIFNNVVIASEKDL